jgi:hypothetical protein
LIDCCLTSNGIYFIRTLPTSGGESRYCEGWASPVPLVTTVVLVFLKMSETIHERREEDIIVTTPLIICTGLSSHDGDRNAFVEITTT